MNDSAQIIDLQDIPVSVFTPRYGYVEHDPQELVESILQSARLLMERHKDKISSLLGIALANQGESFLLWDKATGLPVTPVISWQDGRCGELCDRLQRENINPWFHQKTGLHLSNEWPALKLRYMREQDPDFDALCNSGNLIYGQLDAWFLYVLSKGKHLASDHSTACRSGFYNMQTLSWDAELLAFFRAEQINFPQLEDNTKVFPGVDIGLGRTLPWIAGGLDQSMALLGQQCERPGSAKVTYGTCSSCWMNIGDRMLLDDRLTTSIAWKTGDKIVYGLAAEGMAAGSIVTWLHRNFETQWPLSELAEIAQQHGDQPGLIFVPAFNGIAAPYWEADARGTMFGITAGTKPAHILRAGLDAIAYAVRDMLDAMPPAESIIVDGGMTANGYLMQKQADVLGKAIIRSANAEGTIAGVARLGLMGLGFLKAIPAEDADLDVIQPDPNRTDAGYAMWTRAVKASMNYYKR